MEDMKSLINKIKFVAVEEFIADNADITGSHEMAIQWSAFVMRSYNKIEVTTK